MARSLEEASPVEVDIPIGSAAVRPRQTRPVLWWAAAGLFFLVLQAYIYVAWLTSDKATPTPSGTVPTWIQTNIYVQQAVFSSAAVFCVVRFLVLPWRRERRLTLDGMFLLAFLSLWWQDAFFNYWAPVVTTNSGFVNLGSWASNVPGWNSPNGSLYVEPLLWTGEAYLGFIFLGTVLLSNVMKRARRRWPHLGNVSIVGIAFAFGLVADVVAETIWLRTEMYAYPGAVRSLSLFPGEHYQFPVYEAFLYTSAWTAWASVRFFRSEQGATVAERGIERVLTTPRRRTSLRLMALVGVMNVIYLCVYFIPWSWFALHADPWPEDILKRPWLTNSLCGPGTSYACPGPTNPLNRPDSWHLTPQGEVVEYGEDGPPR